MVRSTQGEGPTRALWPLVGRGEEIALISDALRRGTTSCVVVAGPAGVGKTRVAAEALAEARRSGFATAWAAATGSSSAIPLRALAQLLPLGLGGSRPADLLRRARDALVDAAAGRRLVLAVDDAHMLDSSSAALIHQVVGARDVFVVLTVRASEPVPDAIATLWKDDLCVYVELQALSRVETDELLSCGLGGEVDGETAVALWNVTQGNVLFLRELVRDGLERGVLARTESGSWRWRGLPTPGRRLVELIELRLGALSAEERSHLEYVAFGEPVEARLVSALVDEEVVERLVRRELLTVVVDDRRLHVSTSHPLYGEAIRARCSPLRRAAILGALADALEATGARRRDDLLRLATWRLESGGASAPDVLTRASARAGALFDFALAERLARAGVDSGGGWPARYALSEPLRGLGRFEEADELYAALGVDAETDEQRMLAARDRAANLYWGLGRPEAAEEVLRDAEAVAGSEDDRALLACERGRIAFFSHRPLDALDAVSQILAAEEVRADLGLRAALAAGLALGSIGRLDEALAVVERWRPVAIEHGLSLPRGGLDLAETFALFVGGRLGEATTCAEDGYARALAERSHIGLVQWSAVRGYTALACGRARNALRWFGESLAFVREFDPTGNLCWTHALIAQAAAQIGDVERAEAALAESEAALPDARSLFMYDLFLARAWTAAARGELSRAQEDAWAGAEWCEGRGQLAYVAFLLHDMARLGGAAAAAPRLATLATGVAGPLAAAFSTHAAALVRGDAVELEQAAHSFEACGFLLRAAEAFCDAAVANRLAGRDASARRVHARARLLLERCEQPVTPALGRAGPAQELTGREYEIASLAASGLTSKLIAERLVVSTRTVENHLQHAYRKLGVHTRDELEELLRPPAEI